MRRALLAWAWAWVAAWAWAAAAAASRVDYDEYRGAHMPHYEYDGPRVDDFRDPGEPRVVDGVMLVDPTSPLVPDLDKIRLDDTTEGHSSFVSKREDRHKDWNDILRQRKFKLDKKDSEPKAEAEYAEVPTQLHEDRDDREDRANHEDREEPEEREGRGGRRRRGGRRPARDKERRGKEEDEGPEQDDSQVMEAEDHGNEVAPADPEPGTPPAADDGLEDFYDMRRVQKLQDKLPPMQRRKMPDEAGSGETPAPGAVGFVGAHAADLETVQLLRLVRPPGANASAAERTLLADLQKAARKEGAKLGPRAASKPPVLLQVATGAHTIVMVEQSEQPRGAPDLRRERARHVLAALVKARRAGTESADGDELICRFLDDAELDRMGPGGDVGRALASAVDPEHPDAAPPAPARAAPPRAPAPARAALMLLLNCAMLGFSY